MLEAVLDKAIMTPISTYLTGFETTNLSQVMKTGELTITNADIRPEVLRFLPLPLRLVLGRIDRFMIRIPWAKLSSCPVEVELSGLYVVLAEKDRSEWAFDEEFAIDCLKSRIDSLEAVLKSQKEQKLLSAEEELKGKSFTDRLTAKILDNVVIKVNDIHLRFESHSPKHAIALGLVLQGVSCETTNAQWGRQFVDRQVEGKAAEDIFKLAGIDGLGVYLSAKSTINLQNNPDKDQIITVLKGLISSQPEDTFLISPRKLYISQYRG